jgi:hypothetical protein
MRLRPVLAVSLVISGLMVLPAHAACGVGGVRGRDPGQATINAEIDVATNRRKVPPYLMKAIAWHESRQRQFYGDGRVVLSGACAIGTMQVLARGFDAYRLATDYRYNIDAGAQVIAAKMAASSANVPSSLGRDERRVAENWYRATYRYMGSGYTAMRYADMIWGTVNNPPSEIRRWTVPVRVANPRNVISGYTPQSGNAYVARIDGTWVSTLGSRRHPVTRGDFLATAAVAAPGQRLEGDQAAGTLVRARNIGWETWTTSHVSLSTYPLGRASRLRHPGWLTSTRPVGLYRDTRPGAEGRFYFPVKAFRPGSATTFSEAFVPVLDGSASLAATASSSWTVNPVRNPTASITSAPTYVTDRSTDSTATVGLSYSDPSPGSGVAFVDVQRRAPGATLWTTQRLLASSARVPLSGAGVHELRVRAVDRAGHSSPWSASRNVVVPRDNTNAALTFAGEWATSDVPGSWLGSLATATTGAFVSTTVNGASYAVIGTRGPGLAPVTVYLDDVLVTVIDPDAEAVAHRQVLWSSPLTEGDHVLRLVVGDETVRTQLATSQAREWAYLDAVAVS